MNEDEDDDENGADENMSQGKYTFHWCKQILWRHHSPKISVGVGTDM